METVRLAPCDAPEQPMEVPLRVALQSHTIKNMLEDFGNVAAAEVPIPLHNVTAAILAKVVTYCAHYAERPPLPPSVADDTKTAKAEDILPWDRDFCNVDQATLFELILAANYLDIKPLLDLTCKTVANMIRGKTPAQIRSIFHIKNDFTPEEEEKVRKENEWCEER